jgi:hypothetical protein
MYDQICLAVWIRANGQVNLSTDLESIVPSLQFLVSSFLKSDSVMEKPDRDFVFCGGDWALDRFQRPPAFRLEFEPAEEGIAEKDVHPADKKLTENERGDRIEVPPRDNLPGSGNSSGER